MTKRRLSPTRMATLERLCRERGLPLTVQRRTILESVLRRSDHPTADDVFGDVRRRLPNVSRATVYRGLETLVQLGLIARPSHPGSAARYDPTTDRHHHLVCIRCHRVSDLDAGMVGNVSLPDTRREDFQISDYSVHFMGLCSTCRRLPTPRGRLTTTGSVPRAPRTTPRARR